MPGSTPRVPKQKVLVVWSEEETGKFFEALQKFKCKFKRMAKYIETKSKQEVFKRCTELMTQINEDPDCQGSEHKDQLRKKLKSERKK